MRGGTHVPPALRDGVQVGIGNDPDVFAFLRKAGDESMIVLLNMSAREKAFAFKPGEYGLSDSVKLAPLYSSTPVPQSIAASHILLPPFAVLVTKTQ